MAPSQISRHGCVTSAKRSPSCAKSRWKLSPKPRRTTSSTCSGLPEMPQRPRIDLILRLLAALCATATFAHAGAAALVDDFAIAVANDRVGQVRELLARGADPNAVNAMGDPALVSAARAGNAATVDVLHAAKADVNARNQFRDKAIMAAALAGNLAIVRTLRTRGASLDNPGWNAL